MEFARRNPISISFRGSGENPMDTIYSQLLDGRATAAREELQ